MNAHIATEEYHEGYRSWFAKKKNPYSAGSTKAALWIEGFRDAEEDMTIDLTGADME